MPSPFPGMDPYLEDPQLWPSVHHLLISQIGTTLNRLLPPGYVAAFGERVFVAGPDRDIDPEVFIKDLATGSAAVASSRGGTATAVSDPPWVVAIASDEIVESFIEIRGVTGDQPIVTTIEVLSPQVWGIPLASRLPRVRVPLADSDPDVPLDLQAVFQQVYEAGAFARVLDYSQPPPVPLARADAAWAETVLQAANWRR